ncbi:hypothetical protein IEQ34_021841 [Dendrobium chrysotoxum]|uniref:Uncharacterized protein n=1 Tax=Dendrobium chrysotoxum TaxID=161865 RepID=A0AAV7FW32_DENCH|nr:hypothetical protein IEQ34_021841 [Dendrobium chrysotoxum]
MEDGPDQDPMVPSSRAIVVPGLLSQRSSFNVQVKSKSHFCSSPQNLQMKFRQPPDISPVEGKKPRGCLPLHATWALQVDVHRHRGGIFFLIPARYMSV